MQAQVVCAEPTASMLTVATLMAQHHISSVVIAEACGSEDQYYPLGILTERDVVQFQALGLDLARTTCAEVMSSPLFSLPTEASLWTAHQTMDQYHIRRVIIVGDHGELCGLVTQSSILQAFNPLELYRLTEMLEARVQELEAEKIALLEDRSRTLAQELHARTVTEAALQASEQRFRQIVTTANEGIWVLDPEAQTLFCNNALAQILNCPVEVIQQRSLRDFLAPETQPLLSEHMQRRRQGIQEQYELPLVRPDGSVIYCWVSASPIFDEAGHFVSSLALLTDITERKHIENRLRRSEAHLKLAQRISGVGSWEFDVVTQTIYWSEEVYRIFDVFADGPEPSYEELVQVIIDRDLHQAAVDQAIAQAIPYDAEYRYRRADGSVGYFAARGEPIQDEQGRVVRLTGTVVDITERKRTDLALQAKTEELDRFFSLSVDLLGIANTEGYFVRLNQQWGKTLGYPLAELEGSSFLALLHPDDLDRTFLALKQLEAGETLLHFQNRVELRK